MRTWTTSTTVGAEPGAVLAVLTDPEACRRWAPVDFDVSGLEDSRLVPGSRARVTGRLAGRDVGFDVQVHAAANGLLELTASGPWPWMSATTSRPPPEAARCARPWASAPAAGCSAACWSRRPRRC